MKIFNILLLLFFIILVNSSSSQIVNGRISSTFYTFEKFNDTNTSDTYMRGFQTLQLDVTKNKISFHTVIQGNADLYSTNQGFIRFYNLNLKWRDIWNLFDINVGRHSVFAGVGNGLIDGSTIKLKLMENKFVLTGYVGALVNPLLKGTLHKNVKNNYLAGGQLVTTVVPDLRFGLSYMNKHKERLPYWALRSDSSGSSVQRFIETDSPAEQFAGTDFIYRYGTLFSLNGRYDFDINSFNTSRIQFGTKINVTQNIALTGDFIQRVPRLYYNSIFNVFDYNNTSEIEGGIEYSYTPTMRLFGKFANVKYSGDNTQRFTFGMGAEYGSLVYSGNTGYAGELSSVSVLLFYPLMGKIIVPTISASRSSYKFMKQDLRNETFSGMLGVTIKPEIPFLIDAQVQWLSNKIYKNDFRFFLKINYFFTHRLNLI